MLNREKHQLIMGRILRDIYSDISIASLVGLKGGTCAYFFYGLPRFSIDLDFDFLGDERRNQELLFATIQKIAEKYGTMKDSYIKRNTVFFFLSYGDTDHNIKIEVNIRMDIPHIRNHFELKEHLGISMLVARTPYLFANKLAALTLRNETAMRDIYDIWYFAQNHWDIDMEVLKIRTSKSLKKHLFDCIALIEKIKDHQILQGLGELLDEKAKAWVKTHLRKEVIFLLRNYSSVLT